MPSWLRTTTVGTVTSLPGLQEYGFSTRGPVVIHSCPSILVGALRMDRPTRACYTVVVTTVAVSMAITGVPGSSPVSPAAVVRAVLLSSGPALALIPAEVLGLRLWVRATRTCPVRAARTSSQAILTGHR